MAIPMSHPEEDHKTHPAFLLLRSPLFPELLHCHLLGIVWSEPQGHRLEFECCLDLFAGLSLESLTYGRTSFNHLVSMFSSPSISTAHHRKPQSCVGHCSVQGQPFLSLPALPCPLKSTKVNSFPEIHRYWLTLCIQCPLPFPAPSAPVP